MGFLPIFYPDGLTEDKNKLFCHFMVLSFPETKVNRIVNLLLEDNFLSIDESSKLNHQLALRKKSSKANFQKLASENLCFKKIILKLRSMLGSIQLKKEDEFRRILDSLVSKTTSS